jgi:hypothetical protein
MELFSCTNQNFGFIFAAGSNLLPFGRAAFGFIQKRGEIRLCEPLATLAIFVKRC